MPAAPGTLKQHLSPDQQHREQTEKSGDVLRTRSNYLCFRVECDNDQTDDPKVDWKSDWSGDVAAFRYPSLQDPSTPNAYKLKWELSQTPSPSKMAKPDKNSAAALLSSEGKGEKCLRVKEEQTHVRGLKKNVKASDVWQHAPPMHVETQSVYQDLLNPGKTTKFGVRRMHKAVGKLSALNIDDKLDLQMHIPREAAMDRAAVQYYRYTSSAIWMMVGGSGVSPVDTLAAAKMNQSRKRAGKQPLKNEKQMKNVKCTNK